MPDPASPTAPILSAKGISMAFDGVDVLKNVSLDLYPGEVHALVGENGAGKSTLVKIMAASTSRDWDTSSWMTSRSSCLTRIRPPPWASP